MNFPTDYPTILQRMQAVDPPTYGRTRNFVDGAVSYLSPYISRGVISTKKVFDLILEKDLPWHSMEKFVQELAWRDYWQQIWIAKGNAIDEDLKRPQPGVQHHKIATALVEAKTTITAIDEGINELTSTGYMHNHMRMYVACVGCNIAKGHWSPAAKWMYYHLLDGDWASNALSWQWVAGANAGKQYYANQENINKYFHSRQRGTYLDTTYDQLTELDIPDPLKEVQDLSLETLLPETERPNIDASLPTHLYTYYNLDPTWRKAEPANRILLLEPSFFHKYPVSQRVLDFTQSLSANIPGIQIVVSEFDDFVLQHEVKKPVFKEHPTNQHFKGTEDPRDWMFGVTGYHSSFFSFWKKCQREMKEWQRS